MAVSHNINLLYSVDYEVTHRQQNVASKNRASHFLHSSPFAYFHGTIVLIFRRAWTFVTIRVVRKIQDHWWTNKIDHRFVWFATCGYAKSWSVSALPAQGPPPDNRDSGISRYWISLCIGRALQRALPVLKASASARVAAQTAQHLPFLLIDCWDVAIVIVIANHWPNHSSFHCLAFIANQFRFRFLIRLIPRFIINSEPTEQWKSCLAKCQTIYSLQHF